MSTRKIDLAPNCRVSMIYFTRILDRSAGPNKPLFLSFLFIRSGLRDHGAGMCLDVNIHVIGIWASPIISLGTNPIPDLVRKLMLGF